MSKKNSFQQFNLSLDILKNKDTLIKSLQKNLNLQKQFLKNMNDKLSSFLKNNRKNENEISLIEELIAKLPEFISQLGIPFVYHFLKLEKILETFLNLYYDKYKEKVTEIFKVCLITFSFSSFYDDFNNLKNSLIDFGIVENKDDYTNKNLDMNEEQILFENISSILNKLNKSENKAIDKKTIINLKNKYKDILRNLKQLTNINYLSKAKIEFFQELIKPLGDFIKLIDNKKNNEQIIDNNDDKNIINEEIETNIKIPLDKRTYFYMNEKIKETTNQKIEFKNYSLPLDQMNAYEIKRQLCSFLNSEGGRLYIGINEDNIVKGIDLNYKKRDNLRNTLVNLTYDFYPKCRLDKIFVYFIPIKDINTKNFIKKKYIIKIRILQGDPKVLYSMANKGGYHSTIRHKGDCLDLTSEETYKEIIERNDKNQNILKENEIKDPEPEINNQEIENDSDNDDMPIFEENNLKNFKDDKNIKKENYIAVKLTNIDENLSLNDLNKYFVNCKCSRHKFLIDNGHGFLNFTNKNDANNCIVLYDGKKLGNKTIKLTLMNN